MIVILACLEKNKTLGYLGNISTIDKMAAIVVGHFDFNEIAYNSEELAKALTDMVIYGSKKGVISKDDISVKRAPGSEEVAFGSVAEAVEAGNKFFDSILYMCIPEDERPIPEEHDAGVPIESYPASDIGKAVFYLAFFLLTRGSVPSSNETSTGAHVPAFLQNILGLRRSPRYYADYLASFDLGKMEHSWIKYIDWRKIGPEAKNRLGLGLAGYRMFAPFKLYQPRADMPQALQGPFEWARSVAMSDMDWSIHSVTRDPNVLTRFGNLNKNLGNLMLEAFTAEQLAEMVAARVIFEIPRRDVRSGNYRNWRADELPVLDDPVFRK